MTSPNGLAVRPLTPEVWTMIERVAPVMHAARFFGVSSKDQAAAIMLKGFELGLSLAASFEFIQVVMGKPTLSPRGALALIHRSGELAELDVTEIPDGYAVRMKRTNGVAFAVSWTVDDARRAGLVKPGSAWESYPKNMCRWRAVGFCADVVFPDVIGGLKRADELGAAIDDGGDVIAGEWSVVGEAAAPAPAGAPDPLTLDQLLERFDAEAIVAANEGRIPGTDEELAAVAAKLGAS